jgi:hypothetical protein
VNKDKFLKWVKTALLAALGGGIAAAVAVLFDPAKFDIAHDIGSGKLWTFFLQGAGVTFGALLLKSPLGTQVVGAYKHAQAGLAENQATVAQAKEKLKP